MMETLVISMDVLTHVPCLYVEMVIKREQKNVIWVAKMVYHEVDVVKVVTLFRIPVLVHFLRLVVLYGIEVVVHDE